MRPLSFLALTAALSLTVPVFAQMGAKDVVKRQLNNAVEERNRQMNDAVGNPSPPPENKNLKPYVPTYPTNGQSPTGSTGQTARPPAQPPAPVPIKEGWLMRKARDGKTETRIFFAYPESLNKAAPAAALVVLQEWWGVNADIQQRTREFAQHGFYAAAPDLYRGQTTDDPKTAQKLHDALADDAALIDMKTTIDLLEEEATNGVVDVNRIASIGWCMGGRQSLLLSIADPRIKATALFYGPLVIDPNELKKLQGPVLGIFGSLDKDPSPADVEKFRSALKEAGKSDVTLIQYPGVGHAFASKSAEKLGLYNEAKAREAWNRTWIWLGQKLPRKL